MPTPENKPFSYTGLKIDFEYYNFSTEELQIIDLLISRDWNVTRAEKLEDKVGEIALKAVLVKPQEKIREAFNLMREVVVLFSPYPTLDARSLNGFELVNIPDVRVEEICGILISKDPNPQRIVDSTLKNNIQSRIIVPFTYDELMGVKNPDFIVKRIRERFYSRDLFGIQEALTEDRYFFGRRDLIFDLVNQHLSGVCSGIFGLRKTGKTSILYGVQRTLDRKAAMSVYIDCLTLHFQTWNGALYEVISKVFQDCSVKRSEMHSKEEYIVESEAATLFQQDIERVQQIKKKSILLIFDEIENITFETSPSEFWRNGSYFIMFWQTLRSVFQKLAGRKVFTYLIAGTNPRCIEQPSINKTDNPIFNQFRPHYLEAFSYEQTKEMLDKLGNYMGLTFEEPVIRLLVDDYGGHPMLIRQQCSFIHRQIDWGSRPHTVSVDEYKDYNKRFYKEVGGFIQYAKMILEVLKNWYGVEYEMLELLANDQITEFVEFAEESPDIIAHLLNYGVIGYNDEKSDYYFKIRIIQQYLKKKKKSIKDVKKSGKVFVSYAHTDKEWLERLQTHLKALNNIIPDIDIWSDDVIEAGQDWQDEISRSIENAEVAILLVSTSYLASSFISSKELPQILKKAAEGGPLVIPVIVSPCRYSRSPLSTFQSLNSPDRTLAEMGSPEIDRVFMSLTDKIESLFQ